MMKGMVLHLKRFFHKRYVLLFVIVSGVFVAFPILYVNSKYSKFASYEYPESMQTIYSTDGYILYQIPADGENYFQYVEIEDISDFLLMTVIESEDRNFYERVPVRFGDVVAGIYSTLRGNYRGGSNITQQLIKIRLGYPERTVINKIDEILLTYKIEKEYTKDEILEMYLNSIDWGNMSTGVYTASQRYLSQTPKDLTLSQSAYLVAIMRAPTVYSPYNQRVELDRVQQSILKAIYDRKKIDKETYIISSNETVLFASPEIDMLAPHWVYMIMETDVKNKAMYTTLDYKKYKDILTIVEKHREYFELEFGAYNTGLVLINNKTKEVEVLIGNYSFWDKSNKGSINNATESRHIGSTVKPFITALAYSNGLSSQTLLADIERVYITKDIEGKSKQYYPRNADKQQHGIVTLEESLANSYNIPFVQLLDYLGEDKLEQFLNKTGQPQTEISLSSAVGTVSMSLLDLTNMYTIFTNSGQLCNYKIIKSSDEDFCVDLFSGEQEGKAIADRVTQTLSKWQLGKETFGTQLIFPIESEYAIKTGTTSNFIDNWAVGYTPDYTLGVWVGNADGTPMLQSYGSQTAAQISRAVFDYLDTQGHLPNKLFDSSQIEEDTNIYKVLIPEDQEFAIIYPYDGIEILGNKGSRVSLQIIQSDSNSDYKVFINKKFVGKIEYGVKEVVLDDGENELCVEEVCVDVILLN